MKKAIGAEEDLVRVEEVVVEEVLLDVQLFLPIQTEAVEECWARK